MSAICGSNRGHHMCGAFAKQAPRRRAASCAAIREIKKGGGAQAFAIRDFCLGDAISIPAAPTNIFLNYPSFAS